MYKTTEPQDESLAGRQGPTVVSRQEFAKHGSSALSSNRLSRAKKPTVTPWLYTTFLGRTFKSDRSFAPLLLWQRLGIHQPPRPMSLPFGETTNHGDEVDQNFSHRSHFHTPCHGKNQAINFAPQFRLSVRVLTKVRGCGMSQCSSQQSLGKRVRTRRSRRCGMGWDWQ